MPGYEANIYKGKDGRWEKQYIARKFSHENALDEQQKSDIFENVANEWLDSLKPQLKESSIVKYTNILRSYIFPEFRERKITEISRNDVSAFTCKLLISGGVNGNGLLPKTVVNIISVMKNVFEYASQERSYIVADISGISVRQSQKPMRILSRFEQQNLSQYLCNDLTLCNLGILVCLYTGLRIGEICALKWEDVSFEEQSLYIHRTMQRIQKFENEEKKTVVQISAPKSDCSIRRVPVPDEIFRLIVTLKKPGNTFFLTGEVYSYIEPRTMQNRFKATVKKCNIQDTNFHTLRHTFATRCIEIGFDIKSLSEILGHASVNITLNRYVHPSMELKRKNMNMLSNLFVVK